MGRYTTDDAEAVRDLVVAASAVAREYFGKVEPEVKEDRSYVTAADRAVQELLYEGLSRRFPNAAFLGEEGLSEGLPASEDVWVIDPIDGTSAFVSGLSTWGVGVGLVRGGAPEAGFFRLPLTGREYWVSGSDQPLFEGEREVGRLSPPTLERESLFLTVSRAHQQWSMDRGYPGKVRCLGSSIAHLAYVAAGRAVGALIPRSHAWDLAAALPMLAAVGAKAAYADTGAPVRITDLLDGSRARFEILASHPAVYDELRACLTELRHDAR